MTPRMRRAADGSGLRRALRASATFADEAVIDEGRCSSRFDTDLPDEGARAPRPAVLTNRRGRCAEHGCASPRVATGRRRRVRGGVGQVRLLQGRRRIGRGSVSPHLRRRPGVEMKAQQRTAEQAGPPPTSSTPSRVIRSSRSKGRATGRAGVGSNFLLRGPRSPPKTTIAGLRAMGPPATATGHTGRDGAGAEHTVTFSMLPAPPWRKKAVPAVALRLRAGPRRDPPALRPRFVENRPPRPRLDGVGVASSSTRSTTAFRAMEAGEVHPQRDCLTRGPRQEVVRGVGISGGGRS